MSVSVLKSIQNVCNEALLRPYKRIQSLVEILKLSTEASESNPTQEALEVLDIVSAVIQLNLNIIRECRVIEALIRNNHNVSSKLFNEVIIRYKTNPIWSKYPDNYSIGPVVLHDIPEGVDVDILTYCVITVEALQTGTDKLLSAAQHYAGRKLKP